MGAAPIGAGGLAGRCGTAPRAFARRRETPADPLAESAVAREGRAMKTGPREPAREPGMEEPMSAPGCLRARERLSPEAPPHLAQHHAANARVGGGLEAREGALLVAAGGSAANARAAPGRCGSASARGEARATTGAAGALGATDRQAPSTALDRGGPDGRAREEPRGRRPGGLGEAQAPRGEPRGACRLRRGVETRSQTLEGRLRVEGTAGAKPALIEQGTHAAARPPNAALDMASEAGAMRAPAGARARPWSPSTLKPGRAPVPSHRAPMPSGRIPHLA